MTASDRLSMAALVALILALALAVWAATRRPTFGLDLEAHRWAIQHRDAHPGVTRALRAITVLGHPDVVAVGLVVIAGTWYGLHRLRIVPMARGDALFFLLVAVTARPMIIGSKLAFNRDRPELANRLVVETSQSFPSGHSVFAGVTIGLAILAIRHALHRAPAALRAALILALLVVAILVMFSRVWLGVHYPTDLAGGFALGLGWVVAGRLIQRRLVRGARASNA